MPIFHMHANTLAKSYSVYGLALYCLESHAAHAAEGLHGPLQTSFPTTNRLLPCGYGAAAVPHAAARLALLVLALPSVHSEQKKA